jgi:hypothetical protein
MSTGAHFLLSSAFSPVPRVGFGLEGSAADDPGGAELRSMAPPEVSACPEDGLAAPGFWLPDEEPELWLPEDDPEELSSPPNMGLGVEGSAAPEPEGEELLSFAAPDRSAAPLVAGAASVEAAPVPPLSIVELEPCVVALSAARAAEEHMRSTAAVDMRSFMAFPRG